MINQHVTRRVKYQEDLNPEFGTQVARMAEGEDLHRCIQCGTCSSACPLSIYMDFTPRKVIAMTREGMEQDVLSSNTIWLCASCYSCSMACPKEIKVTEVMYALKRLAMERKLHPKWFPVPVLAREFFHAVWKTGRSNEAWTVTKTFLKTNPLKLLSNAFMGLSLMRRGRMSLKLERMKGDKNQLRQLMETVRHESEELASN